MDGTGFGRYRLVDLLGRGGMGEVWRAFDTETDRVVALKVLPAHLADDPEFEKRFRREAFAAARLANPHVVPIHNFGEIDGRLYVDMRLVEGRDLQNIIAEGALPLARAVEIVSQVASALQAAHKIGLVHRDVKPSNILVDDEDYAYLIDFGIARTAGQTSMTATGSVIGTWAYMAPERLSTDESDSRADVYALACVLHECLTGRQPFPATSLERQIAAIVTEPPPRPSVLQPTVPTSMDAVIAKGMAKSPDERFRTARDLADAARAAATTYPTSIPGAPAPAHDAGTVVLSSTTPLDQTVSLAPDVRAPDGSAQQNAPNDPGPKRDKRRPIALAAAAAVVVICAVIGGIALMNNHRESAAGDRPSVPSAPKALPNTGPFTGTFTAAFSARTRADGSPYTDDPKGAAYSETWQLRSSCGAEGCIATAFTGGGRWAKDVVFDNVGGRWVAVVVSKSKCKDVEDDELWNVITLQPQPNGTLSGESVGTMNAGCASKRSVAFTRVGDADIAQLRDPASLPPRVVSPAEQFSGTYDEVTTFASGKEYRYRVTVRTSCLHAGDRCSSLVLDLGSGAVEEFVFGGGSWTRHDKFHSKTNDCDVDTTATIQLPQPPPREPIQSMVARGYQETSGGNCRKKTTYEETFKRTGD